MEFLRLNIIDGYNMDMGHVDISDQLRGSYCFDHWLRNFKWWHALFWWGFQTMMTNSYIVYKSVMIEAGRSYLTHYDYQNSIGLAWLDAKKFSKSTNTRNDEDSSFSTLSKSSRGTTISSSEGKKGKYLTNHSLHPTSGALCDRLVKMLVTGHCRSQKRKNGGKAPCQLCRWAGGRNVRSTTDVAICEFCGVCLCLDGCYKTFHKVWNICAERESLCCKIKEQKA